MRLQREFTIDEVAPKSSSDRPHRVKVRLFANGTPDVWIEIEAQNTALPNLLRQPGGRVTITIE